MELAEFQKSLQETEGKINARLAAIEDAQRRAAQAGVDGQKAEKPVSFGQAFVKSAGYTDLVAGRIARVRFEKDEDPVITTGSVGGAIASQRIPGVVAAPQQLAIEDLLNSATATSPIIEYAYEKAWTNNAAAVIENGKKPASAIEFDTKQVAVQTIAHIAKVTKQFLQDAPALASFLNTRMLEGLAKVTEDEIMSGSGSAPHLKGIFTSGQYTPHGLVKGTDETNLDLIRKSISAVRIAGYRPNAIILNPVDYVAITGVKDKQGRYLMVEPASGAEPSLWGLRVVQSQAMPQGSFLLGDFTQVDVFNLAAPVLEVFEQDGENVQYNRVTIRAERRVAVAVYAPLALVGGALW